MIKRETYISKIRPFIDKEIVKVLTGIRRCGKSVMLRLICDELVENGRNIENMLFINFESRAMDHVKSVEAAYGYIKDFSESKAGRIYLFLDEVQELGGWEQLVNSCMIDFDCDIYITGSNAKMLSGELATYLGGRYVEIKVYPFSFAEVCDMCPDTPRGELFRTYVRQGGMPFLYQINADEDSARMYLNDIYDSIMLKDIAARNKIRDIEQFRRVLLYFISNIGNTFSASSITKYMKSENRNIAPETLYNFIDYCKSACLLDLLPRQDLVGKNILKFNEKIYLTDHGIREAIYGNNMRDINQVLENIVYTELVRRGFNVFVGKNGTKEIDFVAEKSGRKEYYQVSYLLASKETEEREFGAFEGINDNYPKYVLSMDAFDLGRNGYIHLNIVDFLLGKQ